MTLKGKLVRLVLLPILGVPSLVFLAAHAYCVCFKCFDKWVTRRLPR